MCLSTVFEIRDGAENKLSECVSNITSENGKVSMTDIMGEQITVDGSVKSIDLVKNIIIVSAS